MEKLIKAIIFDMGGVLLRTVYSTPREAIAERFKTTRKELENYVFHSETSLQSEIGEISDIRHWLTVLEHFNQSELDPLEIYTEYFSGDGIDQKLLEFAASLKPNYKIGLLSNAWVDARKKIGESFQFINIFDASIFSAEVGVRKPDQKIFYMMLEKLNVKPEESIFIDDFAENIEGARKLGINTILFKNTDQTICQIQKLIASL